LSLCSYFFFLFTFYSFLHLTPLFFFFNDTATTEIYTLSLHDALPISPSLMRSRRVNVCVPLYKRPGKSILMTTRACCCRDRVNRDRKSTRLNSSHVAISYAVFCLKKKK